MAENEESEIDPAIAEAMGFAGFGMQPGKKRKLNADMAFVDSKAATPQQQTKGKEGIVSGSTNLANAKPASSQTIALGKSQSTPLEQTRPSQQSTSGISAGVIDTATPSEIDGNDEQSLRALANGVRNKNGDMVYFMPNFLEDPWRKLEPRQGS